MKEYDFNVIKEKFDNSGVNAPDALSADAILGRLPEQPLQVQPQKNRRRKAAAIVSAAAAAVAVTVGVTVVLNSLSPPTVYGEPTSLRSFENRAAVREELKRVIAVNKKISKEETSANPLSVPESMMKGAHAADPSAEAHTFNGTYTQSAGVDEADIVKTNGDYVFYLCNGWIVMYSADGKQSRREARITPDDLSAATAGAVPMICDFYVTGDRLTVLCETGISADVGDGFYSYQSATTVYVCDVSDPDAIRTVSTFFQSGNYLESRLIGDTLYLISDQKIRDENDIPGASRPRSTADSASAGASMEPLSYDRVYAMQTPSDTDFTVVSSVNLADPSAAAETKAFLGASATVYCNQEHLYLNAPRYSSGVYDKLINSLLFRSSAEETQIVKISLSDGLRFVASGSVRGSLRNQYSLDEYNGMLRVATTSNAERSPENHLFVLDSSLQELGSVTGFAKNEEIKAVRYLNDTAYVVTYEQTDPLFVIDVSDPQAPKITGEVQLTGFSTMLVPIDDKTLLGIGTDWDDEVWGVKLVTFDVSDKSSPKVLDTKFYPYGESPVVSDPKALLVNAERGDFVLPMTVLSDDDDDQGMCKALNFRVENGRIREIDCYASQKLYNQIDRCVYVDDTVYLLGTDRQFMDAIDCVTYKN